MHKFIKLNQIERKNIIQKAANDLGLRFDIVEKDIWVCYVLQKLFSDEKLKDNLIFKGCTCLSKAYNAIGRFSEDVDITINSKVLNIEASSQTSSGNQKYVKRNKIAAKKFVENEILPILSKTFDDELGNNNYELAFDESDKNNITLFFQFSRSENITPWGSKWGSQWSEKTNSYNYIKPKIKLEFGALGGTFPTQKKAIKPYAKKILTDYFDEFEVNSLDIKRNFIEKLLILHSIYFRPCNKPIHQNYSRHYYDIYSIIKSGLIIDLVKDLKILESVVKNKQDFWNESWVDYENVKQFSDIKLIPNQTRMVEIKKDYKNMEAMFFNNDFPKFEEMILKLQDFENTLMINNNNQNL